MQSLERKTNIFSAILFTLINCTLNCSLKNHLLKVHLKMRFLFWLWSRHDGFERCNFGPVFGSSITMMSNWSYKHHKYRKGWFLSVLQILRLFQLLGILKIEVIQENEAIIESQMKAIIKNEANLWSSVHSIMFPHFHAIGSNYSHVCTNV